MTPDEHQRERMRAWAGWAALTNIEQVDWLLAAFDKRFPAPPVAGHMQPHVMHFAPGMPLPFDSFTSSFPAPSAAAPVEPDVELSGYFVPVAELASLRQKARLWDAVASGKVSLRPPLYGDKFVALYEIRGCEFQKTTEMLPTAEEAVEAAIAAGALK